MPNYLPNTTNITGIVIHEDHTVFPYQGILLSDPDSADQPRGRLTESPLRVVIESSNGTIEVGVGHRGLIWIDSAATMHASNLSSSGHRRLEFHADASDLTEAVRSIAFRPDPDFYGIARCDLLIDDQGRSGKYMKWGETNVGVVSRTTTLGIEIQVLPVDDLPSIHLRSHLTQTVSKIQQANAVPQNVVV